MIPEIEENLLIVATMDSSEFGPWRFGLKIYIQQCSNENTNSELTHCSAPEPWVARYLGRRRTKGFRGRDSSCSLISSILISADWLWRTCRTNGFRGECSSSVMFLSLRLRFVPHTGSVSSISSTWVDWWHQCLKLSITLATHLGNVVLCLIGIHFFSWDCTISDHMWNANRFHLN
jgi:hypothetical protein